MGRWVAMGAIYAAVGLFFGGLAALLRGNPWTHPEPWLSLEAPTAHAYSLLLGLTLGLTVVASTNTLVQKTKWAKRLHEELSPLAQGIPAIGIFFVALFSSLGEELLFRSVLQTSTNLWVQAIIFGLAHQLPGRARWTWALWATIMGLFLGLLFQATGSLLGPIAAHFTINAMNLRFLQKHRPPVPAPQAMGGILGLRN